MSGNLDMPEADWTARELAGRAGAVVVTVDYRLCNEAVHYPVPHDDVVAAIRWARENAPSLGIDQGRLCVGGASAGANLAAGAALKLRDADGQLPAHLIFAYGVAHSVIPPMSADHAALMREVPAMLQFPPEATSFLNLNYLGGPISRPTGTPSRRWRTCAGCAPRWYSTPSTTTCAPPARRSRRRWRPPGSTYGRSWSPRCCTDSSTCPPRSGRSPWRLS